LANQPGGFSFGGKKMKKTIQGFRYNTDNAEKIGKIKRRKKGSSLYIHADIYRTKRVGKLFLVGSGGALTLFKGRENIILPVTKDQLVDFIDLAGFEGGAK
jgi:hypothetical protein